MTKESEATAPWFEVDRDGLRNQAKERGPAHVFLELISNSLDERASGVTQISVKARPVEGKPLVQVTVEDNSPRGYGGYLHHAYTLFASSYKRCNAEQSGQFNFGCKLWLSLCREARISTVTGTVEFDGEGHRSVHPRRKRPVGTLVEGTMEMTREEFRELERLVARLIVPADVEVAFNGTLLTPRTPVRSFTAKLTTKIADTDGVMRSVLRETNIDLYQPVEGTEAMLYELAVPVVETDIRWDIRIGQKVPLNKDRDNVTPAYLREVKRIVADRMVDEIDQEDAAGWCNDVLGDSKASAGACGAIIRGRFGDKAAAYDPSDPESNINWQTDHGGTLVSGGHLTGEQWANVRRHGLLKPAGRLAPSPKPYSEDPDAPPARFYDESELTAGMIAVRDHARTIASAIGVADLVVMFARSMNLSVLGCYLRLGPTSGRLEFNMRVLGEEWFADGVTVAVDELLIHELAHHFVGSHTHPEPSVHVPDGHFYDACCHVAAKVMNLARRQPGPLVGHPVCPVA